MAGKFERKLFSDINLDDPFFDSLKADYPGTSTSTGFVTWFKRKAADGKQRWYLKIAWELVHLLI